MSKLPNQQIVQELVDQMSKVLSGHEAIDCFNATVNMLGRILRCANSPPHALAEAIPMLAKVAGIECEHSFVDLSGEDEEDENGQHATKPLN